MKRPVHFLQVYLEAAGKNIAETGIRGHNAGLSSIVFDRSVRSCSMILALKYPVHHPLANHSTNSTFTRKVASAWFLIESFDVVVGWSIVQDERNNIVPMSLVYVTMKLAAELAVSSVWIDVIESQSSKDFTISFPLIWKSYNVYVTSSRIRTQAFSRATAMIDK